jgi:hypothetical protein
MLDLHEPTMACAVPVVEKKTGQPLPAVAEIQGHVAFYADRVAVTATPGESTVQ